MTTQGVYQQRRCMGLWQLYWNILEALLLASLINGDYGAHGQHHRQDFQCLEEGYHADPNNCQMYYRCVAWGNNRPLTKFDFKCSPGTVFSHVNGDICVHPRESERSECYEYGNDLDSNMNYPQSNEGSYSGYVQPETSPYGELPAGPSYPLPPASPSYGSPTDSPSYQHPQTSPNYGISPATPSYELSYPSTESPSINEIDQPVYLPVSQSPPFSSSQSPPIATTTDNNIPHPISTTTVAGVATGQSECQREGFFANSNDCKKFFRCVNDGRGSYLKYDFTCGEGTVWDPTIEGCNHAWAVSRNDCSTSSQDGDGDSDGNNGQDIDHSQSGGGDHDNDMISQSPWQPDPTQAPSYPSYPPSQSSNDYPVSSSTTGAPSSPDYVSPYETTSQSPSSASLPPLKPLETEVSTSMPPSSTSSPLNGNSGNGNPPESSSTSPGNTDSSPSLSGCSEEGFFPDPNDCMKFYRCVQEVNSLKKYEFTCGEGTAWDESIQSCNHKYAVNSCSGKDHRNDETTASSGGGETSSPLEPNKDQETTTHDKDENQLDVTNPSSSSEAPTSVEESLKPSSSSEAPTTVKESSYPSSSSESPTTVEESSYPSSSEAPTTVKESSNAPSESTQKPEETTEATTASQPSTSSEKPNSTTTSSSESDKDQETDQNHTEATNPPSSSTISESSSVPESSTPPLSSSSSSPTTEASDSSTSHESSSMKPEEPSKSSTPENEPSSTTAATTPPNKPHGSHDSTECHEEGFFPNPTDCRKFYRCVSTGDDKFTKHTFNCALGTAWDQSLLTCNFIEKVASCGSESNEIPTGHEGHEQTSVKPTTESITMSTTAPKEEEVQEIDGTSTTNSNKEESSTTKPSSSTSTESGSDGNHESTSKSPDKETTEKPHGSGDCTTSKPTNNEIVCEVAGFHANPTHCEKFYRCVDNGNGFNVYHFNCPQGTIFDPSIDVCNYPESIYPTRNCDGGEVSPGSTTSEVPSVTESTEEHPTTSESSGETPTITETSSESTTEKIDTEETTTVSTTEIIGSEETSTDSTTEIIGSEETSTESTTETMGVEGTSQESTTESTDTTESATATETTVSEGTTGATTETGVTEMQTTTELSQESSMTTEMAMTTEGISESPVTMTEMPTEASVTDNPESTPPPLETTTTEKTDVDNMVTPCPIGNLTDEQIVLVCPTGFRRHPKYCNMFYQCSNEDEMKIKILVLGCPEGTIYDEEKIQCKPESESSQPCDTQVASSRFYRQLEETPASPVRVRRNSLCPDEGHYPYQQGCSNAFYKCKKNTRNELQGYLYRCPKDYVYWSVSRRCERANRMICSHGKYEDNERIYSWENRWELPIEQSNLSS